MSSSFQFASPLSLIQKSLNRTTPTANNNNNNHKSNSRNTTPLRSPTPSRSSNSLLQSFSSPLRGRWASPGRASTPTNSTTATPTTTTTTSRPRRIHARGFRARPSAETAAATTTTTTTTTTSSGSSPPSVVASPSRPLSLASLIRHSTSPDRTPTGTATAAPPWSQTRGKGRLRRSHRDTEHAENCHVPDLTQSLLLGQSTLSYWSHPDASGGTAEESYLESSESSSTHSGVLAVARAFGGGGRTTTNKLRRCTSRSSTASSSSHLGTTTDSWHTHPSSDDDDDDDDENDQGSHHSSCTQTSLTAAAATAWRWNPEHHPDQEESFSLEEDEDETDNGRASPRALTSPPTLRNLYHDDDDDDDDLCSSSCSGSSSSSHASSRHEGQASQVSWDDHELAARATAFWMTQRQQHQPNTSTDANPSPAKSTKQLEEEFDAFLEAHYGTQVDQNNNNNNNSTLDSSLWSSATVHNSLDHTTTSVLDATTTTTWLPGDDDDLNRPWWQPPPAATNTSLNQSRDSRACSQHTNCSSASPSVLQWTKLSDLTDHVLEQLPESSRLRHLYLQGVRLSREASEDEEDYDDYDEDDDKDLDDDDDESKRGRPISEVDCPGIYPGCAETYDWEVLEDGDDGEVEAIAVPAVPSLSDSYLNTTMSPSHNNSSSRPDDLSSISGAAVLLERLEESLALNTSLTRVVLEDSHAKLLEAILWGLSGLPSQLQDLALLLPCTTTNPTTSTASPRAVSPSQDDYVIWEGLVEVLRQTKTLRRLHLTLSHVDVPPWEMFCQGLAANTTLTSLSIRVHQAHDAVPPTLLHETLADHSELGHTTFVQESSPAVPEQDADDNDEELSFNSSSCLWTWQRQQTTTTTVASAVDSSAIPEETPRQRRRRRQQKRRQWLWQRWRDVTWHTGGRLLTTPPPTATATAANNNTSGR